MESVCCWYYSGCESRSIQVKQKDHQDLGRDLQICGGEIKGETRMLFSGGQQGVAVMVLAGLCQASGVRIEGGLMVAWREWGRRGSEGNCDWISEF